MSDKQKKLIFGSVIGVLIIMFCGGIVLGINDVLLAEGTMEMPAEPPVYKSAEADTAEKGIETLRMLLGECEKKDAENAVKLSVSTGVSVDGDSIANSAGNDGLNSVLVYMKDDLASSAEKYGFNMATGFDESFSDLLIEPAFTAGELAGYEYGTDDNGIDRFMKFVFADEPFGDDQSILYTNFNVRNAEPVFASMKNDCRDVFTVKESAITCAGFELYARYNAVENKLTELSYRRNYSVVLDGAFAGELAQLGENTISFRLSGTEKYSFTYAGLSLSDHVMWLEKGEPDNLEPFRTADEEVEVVWASSDPEIAAVDDEGYVKGKKTSDKPVTVTASFDYLGKTYSDTCTVYVRTPLEEVKLAEREHTMKVGETYVPEAVYNPEKAEIKTLCWFTEDASVADVDANGVITAKKAGAVKVYALSLDGNFKASVEITVLGGADNG